ncbi:MAG TPA: DUF3179 domain-containing protein [Saprospiraceae bacterium]|nr:DUF3179 domain-containing protein [Saprospiraceae bacterium]
MIGQEKRSVSNHDKGQVSYLFARKSKVFINDQGYLTRPELIIEYGFWAREGVADLLPLDYNVKAKNKIPNKVKTDPTLNGFDLSSLLIPFDEIKKGGPPKDGIPSIDRPIFLAAKYAKFLKADDEILGVVRNGKIKAYPIKILDRHEIVNDLFDEEAVVITYCPLCGSGMAFLANVAGQNRNFGVSGLLYNSDVLLYDRESQSLWSQIKSKSVAGKSSGQELVFIPTIHTTWSKWKEQYPNTLVLTKKTGFNYNYDNKAYAAYQDSPKLMFPVANESKAFAKKEKVIGIKVNGKFKAYPFSKLKKSKGIITDVFNGQTLKITFDKAAWVATVRDEVGNDFPAVTLYWFAWYAFHPDTEIYHK